MSLFYSRRFHSFIALPAKTTKQPAVNPLISIHIMQDAGWKKAPWPHYYMNMKVQVLTFTLLFTKYQGVDLGLQGISKLFIFKRCWLNKIIIMIRIIIYSLDKNSKKPLVQKLIKLLFKIICCCKICIKFIPLLKKLHIVNHSHFVFTRQEQIYCCKIERTEGAQHLSQMISWILFINRQSAVAFVMNDVPEEEVGSKQPTWNGRTWVEGGSKTEISCSFLLHLNFALNPHHTTSWDASCMFVLHSNEHVPSTLGMKLIRSALMSLTRTTNG